jgi:hypothetical protein
MSATTTQAGYIDASTERVTAENTIEYAYRDLGESDVPLVLLQHFRGNLDNWDPALIDALAAEGRVVTFDNVGVGATTGRTPNTVEQMAHDAIAFIEALSVRRLLRAAPALPRRLRRCRALPGWSAFRFSPLRLLRCVQFAHADSPSLPESARKDHRGRHADCAELAHRRSDRRRGCRDDRGVDAGRSQILRGKGGHRPALPPRRLTG